MRKKIMALTICLAMLAVAAVGSTLAYYTDATEEVVNTFTVGKVEIELAEPAWNEDDPHILVPGKEPFEKDPTITVKDGSEDCWVFLEIDMNKYISLAKLMGMDAYADDEAFPNLEEYPDLGGFLTAMLDDQATREAIMERWFQGIEHEKWEVMNLREIQDAVEAAAIGRNPQHIKIVLGYKTVCEAGTSIQFMESFGMPGTVTQDMLTASNFNTGQETFNMTFKAYAIQSECFEDLNAAYDRLGIDYEDMGKMD